MSAVPLAETRPVAAHDDTGRRAMPSPSVPRRRPPAPACPAATARAAIRRIQALMREHSITPDELGVAYALSRIHALMERHGITIEELRGDAPAEQQPPRREVQITHCPSVGHDPRYQLPLGAHLVGPFTAEWNRLRGGRR